MELWKDVIGFEGLYEISSFGNIKRNNKLLKPYLGTTGYLFVNLSRASKIKVGKLHRLVAKAFVPNPNNYLLVKHLDNNKLNNCDWNLVWGTHLDNNRDAWRDGLMPRISGEQHHKSMLSVSDILEIRDQFKINPTIETKHKLAIRFNTSVQNVH